MVTAIIAAAGRGTRMGAAFNKVLLPLAGRPILLRTIEALERCKEIEAIVLVTGREDLGAVEGLVDGHAKVSAVVEGGAARCDSVVRGLSVLPPGTEWVAVHDGARPMVSPQLVSALVAAVRETGAAIPALPVSDTVKRSKDGRTVSGAADRAELRAVQTPQVFARDLLERAYRDAAGTGFTGTDDASYVERLGHPVTLVPGERRNIKMTDQEDLRMAEALLGREQRTGFGYDVHRLSPGRGLTLGGVVLEHPAGLGLDGHSDADVLLHAIADAVLGAATMDDIGHHFPNQDPRYAGISSLILLREVARLVAADGWTVLHVDAMLLAERPRIRSHVPQMRENIADALGCRADSVSVKATTGEGLGFVGKEEGMAAQAVATLVRFVGL